jgi:hypothetical protein
VIIPAAASVRILSNLSLEMLPGMLEILNVRGFAATFLVPLHTASIHASDNTEVTTVVTARSISAADILTCVEVRVIVGTCLEDEEALPRLFILTDRVRALGLPSLAKVITKGVSLKLRDLGDLQPEVDGLDACD